MFYPVTTEDFLSLLVLSFQSDKQLKIFSSLLALKTFAHLKNILLTSSLLLVMSSNHFLSLIAC